jgi:hypothetical protein
MSPHLSVRCEYIDLMYFSGAKNRKIIESDVEKEFVFDVNISKFKGREYIKGYVRDLLYNGRTGESVEGNIFANAVTRSYAENVDVQVCALSTDEIKTLIAQKRASCPYGLCLLASDRKTLEYYEDLEGFACDLFYPTSRNLSNALIISPAVDADLLGFKDFIFLDTPLTWGLPTLEGKTVYVNEEICGYQDFTKLDSDRETLLCIYAALKRDLSLLNGNTAEEVASACDSLGFEEKQFIFALHVFEELGLVSFGEGRLTVYRGVKTDLADSALYRSVSRLQEN